MQTLPEFLNEFDATGLTALSRATLGGQEKAVELLIAAKADVMKRDQVSVGCCSSPGPHTPAIPHPPLPTAPPSTTCVPGLLQSGDTALHYAAYCGFERLASLLLDAGADVNALGSDGCSPLAAAEEQEQAGVAALLRARGGSLLRPAADAAAATSSPAPAAARARMTVSTGFPSALEPGLAARLATDAAGYARLRDLLCQSAFLGDLRACHELLTVGGVDASAPDSEGSTALHKAAAGGSLPAILLLLGHGADVHAVDSLGHTPLHYAAYRGNTDAAHALLASGCSTSALNREGRTAEAVARMQGMWAVVRLLTSTWTRLPGLDFSYGVVREGPVQLRRSPDSFLSSVFAWKDKYAVLSRSYNSLFCYSGGVTGGGASGAVASAILRVSCDDFEGASRSTKVRGALRWQAGGGGSGSPGCVCVRTTTLTHSLTALYTPRHTTNAHPTPPHPPSEPCNPCAAAQEWPPAPGNVPGVSRGGHCLD